MSTLFIQVISPLFIALSAWGLWHEWRRIRTTDAFTTDEKTVLGFQIVCSVPILLLTLQWLLPVLDKSVSLAISVPFLIFIALTSIIYRVSIVRPRGLGKAAQGGLAIASGVMILLLTLLLIITTVSPGFPWIVSRGL